jgi:hypothetical protein
LDKEKAKSWISGQITLEDGAVVVFEFSPDKEHGGGSVRFANKEADYNDKMLGTASQLLASRITDLLSRGEVLFSALNEGEGGHGPVPKR